MYTWVILPYIKQIDCHSIFKHYFWAHRSYHGYCLFRIVPGGYGSKLYELSGFTPRYFWDEVEHY